ncbi:hypothetical protein IJU97_05745 [bacterium]|nr:hypothetical protein [bacterium]
MKQKEFLFRFWGKVDDEEKYLTLKLTPAQWPGTDCPNGYLYVQGGDFTIFINRRYEVIREKSSKDWEEYFSIQVSEAGALQVTSIKLRIFLNLPEGIPEGANI